MKILFAGNFHWPMYEEACALALSGLGVDVRRFAWNGYFSSFAGRVQNKFPFPGPATLQLNRELIGATEEFVPDAVFIWRGTHVRQETLKTLKRNTGAILVSYNNDDPFGPEAHGNVPWHHSFFWKMYMACVPEYDIHFVFRAVNIPEILDRGAKGAEVLMPYFIPELHRPVELSEEDRARFECDVVFAGHYEPDGREQYLRQLVDAGLHVRLFGGRYWTRRVLGDLAGRFGKVRPVYGLDYTKALCGAKMCLSLLSKMNRDTYTTRCFEIPACGGLLLSERTDDLRRMFREDEEAVFFSGPEELAEKALWLKSRPDEIERIAAAGMRRVHTDCHSAEGRMKQFLVVLEKHLRKNI